MSQSSLSPDSPSTIRPLDDQQFNDPQGAGQLINHLENEPLGRPRAPAMEGLGQIIQKMIETLSYWKMVRHPRDDFADSDIYSNRDAPPLGTFSNCGWTFQTTVSFDPAEKREITNTSN
jgi:hypothetical protein